MLNTESPNSSKCVIRGCAQQIVCRLIGIFLSAFLLCMGTVLGIILSTPISDATSFDCGRATIRVEKDICANDELSRMDEALAHEYRFAANSVSAGDLSRLKESQQKWLSARNACKTHRCTLEEYEKQILSLRYLNCTEHTSTLEERCPSELPQRLPRTASGKILLLTRKDCRETQSANATEIIADCIEARIYDPCDDAGGTWGAAQCAYAHMEVAERRRRVAEKHLLELWGRSTDARDLRIILSKSNDQWIKAREKSCSARNLNYSKYEFQQEGVDISALVAPPDDAEIWGFCSRRLAEERADDMEYFIKEKQIQGKQHDRNSFTKYLTQRGFKRPSDEKAPPERRPSDFLPTDSCTITRC